MNSNQIKELRNAGNFQAAIEQGLPHITDFKVLIQVNWAYYGLIKQLVTQALNASQSPYGLIRKIYDTARAYAKLPNRRADSSLSNILRELGKISSYSPDYLKFVYWVLRINGVQDSDWQATEFQGKRYSPLVCTMARSLAKWANSFPQYAKPEDLEHIVAWLENTRPVAENDDALWLDWDRVKLLKRLDKHAEAAKVLASVLKAKRNEFWVWQEAGRLYTHEQPDLARACYCCALECKAKPEFTVNVHTELALLLAEQGDTAWAIAEILAVLDIRQKQNWKIGEDLQKIMSESWYNPAATDLPDRAERYALYAPEALMLCFDDVHEQNASFVEILELPPQKNVPNKKQKRLAKFIIQTNKGKAVSILSTNCQTVSNWDAGTPALLTLGMAENAQKVVMHTALRTDGMLWDCANQMVGVVQDSRDDCIWLFLNRDEQIKIHLKEWEGERPTVGTFARLCTSINPKKERTEVLFAQTCEPCEIQDVKTISGCLRRHEKGFAFVDDVFIAPHLLVELADDVQQVELVAVYAKNPKKSEYSWRAVCINGSC